MKGAICYYSGTGNTKLACRYIAANVELPLDLVDVTKDREVDLAPFGALGFATFADFGGPPYLFQTFLEGLPRQAGKPAFVFNTYGAISAKTLRMLETAVKAKGFKVIAGHALHTPENYPPMIARGMGAPEAPRDKEMQGFEAFISELDELLRKVAKGEMVEGRRVRPGFVNSLLPARRRTWARDDMGAKHVDDSLCTECGTCEKGCPYGAIELDPKPEFDGGACYGCWRCYNRCPEHAIYTERFRGGPFYPRPNDQLREALKV